MLSRRTPAGEVLSVAAGDSDQFGALSEVTSRAVGAFAAYLVIAGIMLSTSLELGIVVLVAAPLLVLLALPLLRPMQRRQEVERDRTAELTSLATDIVAGLRILRGIGGERTFVGQLRPAVPVDPAGRGRRRSLAGRRSTRWPCCSPGCSWSC